MQLALEVLRCQGCHSKGAGGFLFRAAPVGAEVDENCRAVLAKVDLHYPPVRHVLLRVRKDCLQARLLAWLAEKPDPACTVKLENFKGRRRME